MNEGQITSARTVSTKPATEIAVTALPAPHQTARPPTIRAPNGPVPIDAASTPSTLPRISAGVEVITMMLCIVANPDIENPPIIKIGRAIQYEGESENPRIDVRNKTDPNA